MSRGGKGVRKVPKKCHVLFEWPLTAFVSVVLVYFKQSAPDDESENFSAFFFQNIEF